MKKVLRKAAALGVSPETIRKIAESCADTSDDVTEAKSCIIRKVRKVNRQLEEY
ncbi:MAG: hypothetical protein ACTSRS_07600 [Candidatus Helarchaeota archaeon]